MTFDKIAADVAALFTMGTDTPAELERIAEGLRLASRRVEEQAAWARIELEDAA
jgi:hypothetical protein